jgi:hypothetical protein
MIAVIAGGSSDLLLSPAEIRAKRSVFQGVDPRLFRMNQRYSGIYKRVAERMGLTRRYVTAIGEGWQKSNRVSLELRAEMAKMDAEFLDRPAPLTAGQISQFKRGGRYFGLGSRTAQSLGLSKSAGTKAIHGGGRRGLKVLTALRAEMARVDAQIAAKTEASA